MKKILFYSPYGSRTGSDMMLSYIIRNINREKFQPIVFSERRWDLIKDFDSEIPRFSSRLQFSRMNRVLDWFGRRLLNISLYENEWMRIIRKHKPDLIYLNTINSQRAIPVLKKSQLPFIVHCHELTYSYQFIGSEDMKYLVEKSEVMIGCSRKVCAQLSILGARKVALLPEAIDAIRIKQANHTSAGIREKLKIPLNAFVWVMAGLRHYRKGFDFIPFIAKKIRENNGWLIWMGKSFDSSYELLVKKQIEAEGLKNVILLDHQDADYFPVLQSADGLLLTSREDPFPLVMLEAAWLQKPVVSFNSGGIEEFLKEKMGTVIHNFDLDEIGNVLLKYMRHEIEIDKELIKREADKYEIKTIISQWEAIIDKNIG